MWGREISFPALDRRGASDDGSSCYFALNIIIINQVDDFHISISRPGPAVTEVRGHDDVACNVQAGDSVIVCMPTCPLLVGKIRR